MGTPAQYPRPQAAQHPLPGMLRLHSPACRMGPLSVLPPKPNLSQKGGAQWASQWQFFLLLHTFGAEVEKNIQRGQDTQGQGTLPDPLSNTCRLSKCETERLSPGQHRTSELDPQRRRTAQPACAQELLLRAAPLSWSPQESYGAALLGG